MEGHTQKRYGRVKGCGTEGGGWGCTEELKNATRALRTQQQEMERARRWETYSREPKPGSRKTYPQVMEERAGGENAEAGITKIHRWVRGVCKTYPVRTGHERRAGTEVCVLWVGWGGGAGAGRGGHTYEGWHWWDSGQNGLGDVLVEHFARQEEVKRRWQRERRNQLQQTCVVMATQLVLDDLAAQVAKWQRWRWVLFVPDTHKFSQLVSLWGLRKVSSKSPNRTENHKHTHKQHFNSSSTDKVLKPIICKSTSKVKQKQILFVANRTVGGSSTQALQARKSAYTSHPQY